MVPIARTALSNVPNTVGNWGVYAIRSASKPGSRLTTSNELRKVGSGAMVLVEHKKRAQRGARDLTASGRVRLV